MEDKVKEILERIKGTAATVGGAAYNAGKDAGKFAGETIEIVKLNMKIFDLKMERESVLKKLGTLIYNTHCGKETEDEQVDKLLDEIDSNNLEIAELRKRAAELKKTVVCPECGEICGRSDAYCRKCGHNF